MFHNLQINLGKLRIDELINSYEIIADLKLYNIILGLMNHKSKYPCYICKSFIQKDGTLEVADRRTLLNLVEDHDLWIDSEKGR